MTSAPRFFVNAHFDGDLVAPVWTAARFIPDKPITVTRVTADLKTAADLTCTSQAVVRVTDGAKGQDLVVSKGTQSFDTGPLALTFGAGTPVRVQLRDGATCGGAPKPASGNVIVHYRMQGPEDADACPSGHTACSGICENLAADTANCGGCGSACSTTNATPSCVNSACQVACNAGFGNCNNNAGDGCESNFNTNADHCSNCGAACSSNNLDTRTCAGGVCNGTCTSGFGDCNNNKLTDGCETPVSADPDKCGACDAVCSSNNMATRTCAASVCNGNCATNFGDCNNNKLTDGCETSLTTLTNCGACGVQCSRANATATCASATCQLASCNNGFANCDGNSANGCEIQNSGSANLGSSGPFDADRIQSCTQVASTSRTQGAELSVGAHEASNLISDLTLKFVLTVPVGTDINYDLSLTGGFICNPGSCSSANGPGQNEAVTVTRGDNLGADDSFTVTVHIVFISGGSCQPWTLQIFAGAC